MNCLTSADRSVEPDLSGLTILLVEDEAIVALDIEDCFREWGATIFGPFGTLTDATAGAQNARMDGMQIDAAVLDVMLGSESVVPLAEHLRDLGTPLVFHSGHADPAELTGSFPLATLRIKPVSPTDLAHSVIALVGERA